MTLIDPTFVTGDSALLPLKRMRTASFLERPTLALTTVALKLNEQVVFTAAVFDVIGVAARRTVTMTSCP